MSIYQQNARAFIDVINSNSDLISVSDRQELKKLIDNLPEDDSEICEQIEEWLEDKSRAKILAAYEEKLDEMSSPSSTETEKTLGPGGSQPTNTPSPESESLQKQIQQSIVINSPLPKDRDKK